MKNFRNIFFALTIITLLLAVATVTAADNTDNNSVITDAPTTVADTDSSTITQEATTTSDNMMTNTKNEVKKDDREAKTYIVTNRTAKYYFSPTDGGRLTSLVNTGDTLDIQGEISGIAELNNMCINKPVNIISSTQNSNISLNTTNGDLSGANPGNTFSITNDGAGTNITGIYFYNTQLWLYNTNHVTLDNITAVVDSQTVGSGVGQTSIRANSSYITVKNSHFYTKDNGGSSSLVLAWADYCDLINNTVQAVGRVGNMIYITTYNVDIPQNIICNSHNRIINNTLTGPEEAAGICYGICISGIDNLIDGNTINYSGTGITEQWGSGTSSFEENSQVTIIDNIVSNNKLYGGCGITKVNGIIYNNYMEGKLSTLSTTYNNTAQSAQITGNSTEFYNNTINGSLTIDKIQNTKIYDNIINGNITISTSATNNTLTNNNITGSIKLDGSNNQITSNTIKTTQNYTITGNKHTSINNTITNNYLEAKELYGIKSIKINNEENTIENNMPYDNMIQVDTTTFTIGQNSNITATIYYGDQINTTINKGKVAFKVNGKTLKDDNGKVIYAKVTNGQATIESYPIPTTWNKDNLIIEAVYSGSTQCEALRSQQTPMTINKDEPTITTEDITTTVGATINLTATITDGNKVINTGKVVFKVNGKSVKDSNGNVIYVPIKDNKVNYEYILPEIYKAKEYTIMATLISTDYDRLSDSKTLTITKA